MLHFPDTPINYETLGIKREWEIDMMSTLHFHRSIVVYNAEAMCEEFTERSYLIDTLANALNHDASKINGQEYVPYLMKIYSEESPVWYNVEAEFEYAKQIHITTNPHHPEYWASPNLMPDAYIAEMVCDWAAMAHQNGNTTTAWAKDHAFSRWGFNDQKLGMIFEYATFTDSIMDALTWEGDDAS